MQRFLGFAILVAGTATVSFPALAAHRGSMEDQLACTPDVYRLCSKYIPDEDSIVGCLQRNVASLSSACHEVFTRPEGKPSNNEDQDED